MQLNPDLSGEVAVVLGHGNVALDIARILLTPIDILKASRIRALDSRTTGNYTVLYVL